MTSAPISSTCAGTPSGKDVLRHGNAYYKPADTRRYDGPALPPNGTPTRTPSLERLNERLETLAFGERVGGREAPPVETYTVASTEHGDVVSATPEYIRWFHRTYPASGPEDRVSKPPPRPTPEGVGGTQGRWKQNDLAP